VEACDGLWHQTAFLVCQTANGGWQLVSFFCDLPSTNTECHVDQMQRPMGSKANASSSISPFAEPCRAFRMVTEHGTTHKASRQARMVTIPNALINSLPRRYVANIVHIGRAEDSAQPPLRRAGFLVGKQAISALLSMGHGATCTEGIY
jgi:hypothetical protein